MKDDTLGNLFAVSVVIIIVTLFVSLIYGVLNNISWIFVIGDQTLNFTWAPVVLFILVIALIISFVYTKLKYGFN